MNEKKYKYITFKMIPTLDGKSTEGKIVEAIPIEWIEKWIDSGTTNAYVWNDTGYQVIHSLIEDWENYNNDN